MFVSRRPQKLPRVAAPDLREDGASFDQPLPLVRKATREVVGLQLGRRGWFTALAFIVAMFASQAVVGVAMALASGLSNAAEAVISTIAYFVSAAIIYWVMVTWLEKRRSPIEFRSSGALAGLGAGILTGFVLIWICVGAMIALGGWRIVGLNPNYTFSWLDLLSFGFAAGIAEEIMFRGIFFRILERSVGTWWSALISGGSFGLAHLGNPDATAAGAANIVLAGLMLALMYVATRSLWFVIAVHASWNLTQGSLVGSSVSGTGAPNGYLLSEPVGSALLNGGKFGLEAAVPTAVVLAIVTAGVAWYVHRRNLAMKPLWTRRRTNPIMQAASQGHPVEEADHIEIQANGSQVVTSGGAPVDDQHRLAGASHLPNEPQP